MTRSGIEPRTPGPVANTLPNRPKRKRKYEQIFAKAVKQDGDGDTNSDWSTRHSFQGLGKETGEIGNQRKKRDHLHYSIVEIGWNTEQSSGDLKKLLLRRWW